MRSLALLPGLLFLIPLVSAQTTAPNNRVGPLSERFGSIAPNVGDGNTVSVRDLSIPGKARRSFQKGARLLAEGNAAGSILEFERAIAAYNSYYEAFYQLGICKLILGESQEASDAFTKSIQLSEGRFAQSYFALSMILSHDRVFAEADTLAKTGLSLEPASLLGQFSLGWAEMGLGHTDFAEKTLREVLQRRENFREARLLLTEIHRQQNNLPEVIADVEAYLKQDSSSPTSAQLLTLRETALRALSQRGNKTSLIATAQP